MTYIPERFRSERLSYAYECGFRSGMVDEACDRPWGEEVVTDSWDEAWNAGYKAGRQYPRHVRL